MRLVRENGDEGRREIGLPFQVRESKALDLRGGVDEGGLVAGAKSVVWGVSGLGTGVVNAVEGSRNRRGRGFGAEKRGG